MDSPVDAAHTLPLRDRLNRLRRERSRHRLADELDAIARHCAALPVLDPRSAEDIIGYDERGIPSAERALIEPTKVRGYCSHESIR